MKIQSMLITYQNLLTELMQYGIWEKNQRTQTKIKVLPGGYSFKLDLTSNKLSIAGNRKYYPRVAAAEVAWQFMGTKDPDFIINKAPKLWSKFIEDGELKTAYGYRWRKHFGRDQLQLAMTELKLNPTNRQIYISAWDPANDGLGGLQPKNIPCPVGFSLTRHENALHASVFLRSSDVFVGLPYDVMSYALTLDAIACEVNCYPASLHFTLAHAHIYEPHLPAVHTCLDQKKFKWAINCEPYFPKWSVSQILTDPIGYINTVTVLTQQVYMNSFDPLPEIIE